MSWRILEETKARVLADGRPSFTIVVGWDHTVRSFFCLGQDNTGQTEREVGTEFFLSVGSDGSLPDIEDLVGILYRLHLEGFIFWPLDTALFGVLEDDKMFSVSAEHQDDSAVSRLRRALLAG